MLAIARRGITLVELVTALTLLSIVATLMCRVLLSSQRLYTAQAQRVDLAQNLRAAATILPAELRQLDAADSDIAAMTAHTITLRTTEQLAFLCLPPEPRSGGELAVSVRQEPLFGLRRSFTAGDSLLLYYEGDPTTESDDTWVRGQVVAAASRDCPDPDRARPGYEVRVRMHWPREGEFDAGAVTAGSPLRGFAAVTYAAYQSGADRRWYLGQQLAASTIQPLVGPLTGADGLTLGYFDSAGAPTAVPTAVAEIEIRVRARTALPIVGPRLGAAMFVVDSLVTRVALRNNARR